MSYKCSKCGDDDVKKEKNWVNMLFLDGAGYFLDFPYGPKYKCNKCGAESEDNCFIATVVYGDKSAASVQALRGFRDRVLIKSAAGQTFINFYYSGAGRKVAKIIKEHVPSLVPVIRKGLDVLVDRYSKMY
jgi:DNA-directed RNA polymerase subunit RPC12/RpoP